MKGHSHTNSHFSTACFGCVCVCVCVSAGTRICVGGDACGPSQTCPETACTLKVPTPTPMPSSCRVDTGMGSSSGPKPFQPCCCSACLERRRLKDLFSALLRASRGCGCWCDSRPLERPELGAPDEQVGPPHREPSETVEEPSELTSDQAVSLDELVERSASGEGRKCRSWKLPPLHLGTPLKMAAGAEPEAFSVSAFSLALTL